ncbi:glyoxalase [Flavobacterium sp.]|jgi:hypothetical protein|uniref:glyoxalase n=1 Tax=Flavobacterium sp. TaxID=239 RepID=UPI0037BE77E5
MKNNMLSIRPFIGTKDFKISKSFYADLGFEAIELSNDLCLLKMNTVHFYLQNAYVKDWVDNTMVFIEVENVEKFYRNLLDLKLTSKYDAVKIVPIRALAWGKECFVHDPSGILWHFGEFKKY